MLEFMERWEPRRSVVVLSRMSGAVVQSSRTSLRVLLMGRVNIFRRRGSRLRAGGGRGCFDSGMVRGKGMRERRR